MQKAYWRSLWQKHLGFIALVIFAFIVFAGVTYKAATASMTHDESSTYLNLVEGSTLSLWTCYKDPACWSTANNHLLNTQMMRWSARLYGPTPFALRLPNLLFLALYLIGVISLLHDTTERISGMLFGVGVLVCNPFVLDFFGLARGYGMGLGLTMISMIAMWKYFLHHRPVFGVLACVAAVAAVFANLTYLAYVAALTASVFFLFIPPLFKHQQRYISGVLPASIALSLIFLAAYFYHPVMTLIGKGEFTYGVPTLWESWTGFARDSLYGWQWIGNSTVTVVSVLSAVMLFAGLIVVWLPDRSLRTGADIVFGRWCSILCVSLVVFFIANHLLTGANYPSGRKSLVYFAPAALLIYFAAKRLAGKRMPAQIVMGLAGLWLVIHLSRTFDTKTYREWWYDNDTREMVETVAAMASSGDPVSLGVEWIFHPSAQFYVQTRHLPVRLAPYSKEVSKDNPVVYYYVHPEFVQQLEPEFSVEKNFGGKLLLRRVPETRRVNDQSDEQE